MSTQKVYAAIAAVMADLSHEGIGKDRRNQQQGYSFRGIDDVYNALSPVLSKHKLCVLPRVLSRECVERVNSKGNPLFFVTVEAEFDFVSAEDGSKHTIRTFGEAMDSADKATNKAMSAAYKYAAMQAFAIPTEGDNDADAHTPDIAPRQQTAARREAPRKEATPFDDNPDEAEAFAYVETAIKVIAKAVTRSELSEWWTSEKPRRAAYGLTQAQVDILKGKLMEKAESLPAEQEAA